MSEQGKKQGAQQGTPWQGLFPPNEFRSNFTFHAPVNEEGGLKKNSFEKECFRNNTLKGNKTTMDKSSSASLNLTASQ